MWVVDTTESSFSKSTFNTLILLCVIDLICCKVLFYQIGLIFFQVIQKQHYEVATTNYLSDNYLL